MKYDHFAVIRQSADVDDQRLSWRKAVQGEAQASAAEVIEVVEALLQDPPAQVLRQLSSELILGLRDMRNLTQRMLQTQDSDPHSASQPAAAPREMAGTLLAQIASARQLADVMRYYALALAESDADALPPGV